MTKTNKIVFGIISISALAVAVYLITSTSSNSEDDSFTEEEEEFSACDNLQASTCGIDHSMNFIENGGDGSVIKVLQSCCEKKGYEWGSYDGVSKPSCLCS